MKALPLSGPGPTPKPVEPLDLQPGDLVQVRAKKEIASTLDARGHLRGLSFDREMLPYCGGTYRVQDRVRRLIDDRTGGMIASAVQDVGSAHVRSSPTGRKCGFVQWESHRTTRSPSPRSHRFNTEHLPRGSVYDPTPIGVVLSVWISLALSALP
jgi:hypothetical protein